MAESVEQLSDFLTKASFFCGVCENSLRNLSKEAEILHFEEKETIFKKGDPGEAMFVIVSGRVNVHENDHHFGELGEGDCFGEYALIDNKPRSASVTAASKTKVVRIERGNFLDLIKMDQGFAQGILSVMINRHRERDSTQERLNNSKKQLERANYKMEGLINGAMDAIIMFDDKFRIILTNPAANKLLENEDAQQRNVLFFFDDSSADLIEQLITSTTPGRANDFNTYLPEIIKVIGSEGRETLNEGTISRYGQQDAVYYTLILRDIHERLIAEDTINLLTKQTEYLEEEIKELTNSYGIIAKDKCMMHVLNLVEQVAQTDATVLIQGETGTGKELVARAIHKSSQRNDKPLIRINCGAIPVNLIESELFGHEKGAFTGATSSRKGRFLLADKGTIFLDEIGELPLELQPKLLRVIQEGEFDPVGSSETIKVDVRIIAATHRDLLSFSGEGKFREDLYYRLNVFPIEVPPLRNRGEDIHLIAQEIINQYSAKLNKKILPLSEEDKLALSRYSWPGNVRELQNIIERAVIICENNCLGWEVLIPRSVQEEGELNAVEETRIFTNDEFTNLERENILKALRKTAWKISGSGGAASLLQLPPTTLTSKIKALKIKRPV